MCWLTQWQGWKRPNLYWPDIWASTLCNNTFMIGWWHFNASCTPNNLRLITSTGCSRIEHLNNKLEGNAAEWYSICCRSKVCNLQYTADEAIGLYAVALQIEDFASTTDTVPLSSIPLQFIIEVFSSTAPCASSSNQPEVVGGTRCIEVSSTYQERIVAESGGSNIRSVTCKTETLLPEWYHKSTHPSILKVSLLSNPLNHSRFTVNGCISLEKFWVAERIIGSLLFLPAS